MASRCSEDGGKIAISRSKRPARRSAGSRSNGRVVVATTRTRGDARRPSMEVRSCATTCTLVCEACDRLTQSRSMSSMRTMASAAESFATTAVACEKRSRRGGGERDTLDDARFLAVGGGERGGGEGLEEEVEKRLAEGDGFVDLERRGREERRFASCPGRGRRRGECL